MFSAPLSTQIIGKNLVYLPTCASTNAEAQAYLQQSYPLEGTVVVTSEQTAGRGQRGTTWETAPHQNLTFSIILAPKFLQATEQFQLNVAVTVGIVQALQRHIALQIKWSNDLYAEGKKMGGILIENILQHNYLRYSIIGIGINVNQIDFGQFALTAPPTKQPTSLHALTQQTYNLQHLLNDILLGIEQTYFQLRTNQFNLLKMQYLQHLFWYQELHTFEVAGKLVEGYITGIDSQGRLAVAIENTLQYFDVKEIVFVQ